MIIFSVKINDVGGWFLSHLILYFKNEFCDVSPSLLTSRKMKRVSCANCASHIFLPIIDRRDKKTLTKQISFKQTAYSRGEKCLGIILGN